MSADDARKLFVGGLSDAATEEDLRDIFANAGFTVLQLAVPRDRETGRLRGFAFVTLSSVEEAQAARSKVQGMMCGGRPLSVREFSQGPQKPPPKPRGEEPTVFLGKLPFDATPEEVAEFFTEAGVGPVVRVTLPAGPDGRPRGFGFATLETPEAAQQAVEQLNGAAMRGRSIVVSPAQPRGRPGGPSGPGAPGGVPRGGPGRGRGDAPDASGNPGFQGGGGTYQAGGGTYQPGGSYQSRGPRAVPREPEAEFFPTEPPPFPPADDAEGRRRRAEPRKKERGAAEKKRGAEASPKAGRRPRGGASSWHQWDSDED